MPRNISMAEFEAKIELLSSGWDTKVPPDVEALYVDGRKYDRQELGEALRMIAGHLKNVHTTRSAYRASVAFRDQRLAEWHAMVAAVCAQLLQRMGHASAALRNLGVTPPKERAQPSVEDQAIAAEQRFGSEVVPRSRSRRRSRFSRDRGNDLGSDFGNDQVQRAQLAERVEDRLLGDREPLPQRAHGARALGANRPAEGDLRGPLPGDARRARGGRRQARQSTWCFCRRRSCVCRTDCSGDRQVDAQASFEVQRAERRGSGRFVAVKPRVGRIGQVRAARNGGRDPRDGRPGGDGERRRGPRPAGGDRRQRGRACGGTRRGGDAQVATGAAAGSGATR